MWLLFALLSAVFAALTSILAKLGIDGVNSNLATAIRTVVVLVMAWGMVFLTHAQSGLAEISRKTAVGRYRLAQSAFFAVSTSALKASASLMASSDRLLRFISTFAFFRPFMKRE